MQPTPEQISQLQRLVTGNDDSGRMEIPVTKEQLQRLRLVLQQEREFILQNGLRWDAANTLTIAHTDGQLRGRLSMMEDLLRACVVVDSLHSN